MWQNSALYVSADNWGWSLCLFTMHKKEGVQARLHASFWPVIKWVLRNVSVEVCIYVGAHNTHTYTCTHARTRLPACTTALASKSCNYRQSVSQFALVSSPFWSRRPDFYCCQTVAVLSMWDALSDERVGLSFTMFIISSTCHLYL
jgi:hypothetical protein